LLCVTHDVSETRAFERVLVIEDGKIAEDGHPAALAEKPLSRYRSLLDAERDVQLSGWSRGVWRRLHLDNGVIRSQSLERQRTQGASS
jgi:ATP-binding cassette subfamily B protein